MKIHLENIGEIVDGAFFEQNDKCLSLFINTKHKGVSPEYVSSWEGSSQYVFKECDRVEGVTLVAQCAGDVDTLNRLAFNLHDKDQLWYLYLADDVYRAK